MLRVPSAHLRAELDVLRRLLCTVFVKKTNSGSLVLSQIAEGPRVFFALMVCVKEEKTRAATCTQLLPREHRSSRHPRVGAAVLRSSARLAMSSSSSLAPHTPPLCWRADENLGFLNTGAEKQLLQQSHVQAPPQADTVL